MAKNSNKWLFKTIALVRIALGFIFFWAFLDKLVGLGYTTCLDAKTGVVTRFCALSWLRGGSPTSGFLKNAVTGPFENFFNNLAGIATVDWLFMIGLCLIGICLIFGIGIKVASTSGVILMIMMWLSLLPPTNNPFLDEHIIYSLVLIIICLANNQQVWGLGSWWGRRKIVRRFNFLQ